MKARFIVEIIVSKDQSDLEIGGGKILEVSNISLFDLADEIENAILKSQEVFEIVQKRKEIFWGVDVTPKG
jgi:hypothetical protein